MPIQNPKRSAHHTLGDIAAGPSLHGLGVIIPQEFESNKGPQFGDLESEGDERIQNGDQNHQPAYFQNSLHPRKPRSAARKAPTKTMLNAYVLMRGRQDTEERGPLYREGFIQPPWDQKPEDVRPGEHRISPPLPYDKASEEKAYAATPDLKKIRESRRRTSSEILNMMGYMKLNGKVTDPDSRDDVFRALNGIRGDTPPIPGLNDGVTKHLHIMTPSELKKFYNHFVQDVSDDEGNPLHRRISPGTFRDWAEGAKGKSAPNTDRIEEGVKAAEMKEEKPPGKSKYEKWSRHSPQFDQETGSILTPAYSVDEFPSPLRSPQKVDLDGVPSMFTYMLPEIGKMLARVTLYDGGDIEDPGEAPSEAEIITDELLAEALGDGDQALGMRRVAEARQAFEALMAECDARLRESSQLKRVRQSLHGEVDKLEKVLISRRQEAEAPARRARAIFIMQDCEETLRQHIARVEHGNRLLRRSIANLREIAGRLVAQIESTEKQIAVGLR